MNFDYQGWLYTAISKVINDLEYEVEFKISDEQMFVKDKDKQPDLLYIVYKQMTGPNSFGVATMPYNLLIMSEQNQLEMAKTIANKFAIDNNFAVVKSGDSLIKHEYNQPSVMSNFNQVDIGTRSIIYIPTTLTIMYGLAFLEYNNEYGIIHVGGDYNENIRLLSFNLSYSMSPDTQALPTEEISKSKKSLATLAISFMIPLYDDKTFLVGKKTNDTWTKKGILHIINGSLSGNTTFNLVFNYKNVEYNLNVKLISATLDETPTEAPGLRLGFMV